MKLIQHVVMIALFLLTVSGCEKEAPTDGGETGPTPIPSSMQQVDIPWPSLANSPWPMHRHDPQRTGRSPFRGPQIGQIEWAANPVRDYQLETAIAIGLDNTLYYSSPFNHLVALNPDSTERWKLQLDGWPSWAGLHILADGTVWVDTWRWNFLYGVNLDGAELSKVALPMSLGPVVVGKDGTLYGVGEDKKLYALTRSGTTAWSLFLDSGFSSEPLTALSPDGLTIYVAGADSGLYAISTAGELAWRHGLGGSRFFQGILIDNQGNVYVTPYLRAGYVSGELVSFNPDGSLRWVYKFAANGMNQPNSSLTMDHSGYIYLTDNANRRIISLDYAGKLRWQTAYPPGSVVDSPLICDNEGTVYVLFSYAPPDQNFEAIRSNGQKLWVSSLPDVEGFPTDIWSQPAIGSNGRLYLAHEYDRRIYAVW